MFDRSDEKFKPIEISIGLLAGTLIAGLINMMITGKTWTEVFENDKLLMGFVGIVVALFLYIRQKKKATELEE